MVSGGTVLGDLSSLKTCFQGYTSEIGNLSSSWKGLSFDNLNSKANEFCSEYSSAISNQMDAFASACDLYVEYQTCKTNLSIAQNNYNQAVANKDSSAITNYGNQITSYSTNLSTLKSQIESLLASASSVQFQATSTTTGNFTDLSGLGTPSFGSFAKQETFVASNGLKMEYYLYQPDYGQDVTGLPVMMYMHGGGSDNSISSLLSRGLSKALNEKTINPSGIVIIPFIKDFTDKKTVPALKELTDYVVETYHADPNRISVSGHSYGGITTYRLINAYPDYYAAAIPISGWTDEVSDSFKNVKIWAFNGKLDTGSHTSWSGAVNAVDKINNMGGNATLYTYEKYGHGYVQDKTYEGEFESPDGDTVSPLEWAFRQKKETTNV